MTSHNAVFLWIFDRAVNRASTLFPYCDHVAIPLFTLYSADTAHRLPDGFRQAGSQSFLWNRGPSCSNSFVERTVVSGVGNFFCFNGAAAFRIDARVIPFYRLKTRECTLPTQKGTGCERRLIRPTGNIREDAFSLSPCFSHTTDAHLTPQIQGGWVSDIRLGLSPLVSKDFTPPPYQGPPGFLAPIYGSPSLRRPNFRF